MVEMKVLEKVTSLVSEGELEAAERILKEYVAQNPYDIEGWNRLIILATLDPIEDYERATNYARAALRYQKNNPLYYILILSFTPWYRGELNDELVAETTYVQNEMSSEFASIISLQLAKHYESKNMVQYEDLLKKSIKENPNIVKSYTELGQYYLSNGQKDKGKELVRKGLSRVKLVYKDQGDDEAIDWLDIERYINEMVTGVYMTESTYRELLLLLQQ